MRNSHTNVWGLFKKGKKKPAKNSSTDMVTLHRYHLKDLAEQGKEEDTNITEENKITKEKGRDGLEKN